MAQVRPGAARSGTASACASRSKIGDTVQKIALARWSRTFSALYSAGVPIMQAIEVTGQTAGNAVIEKAMDDVIESVKSGGSIAAPLQATPRSSRRWSPR